MAPLGSSWQFPSSTLRLGRLWLWWAVSALVRLPCCKPLMGHMPHKAGQFHVGGQIAYVPQTAWIQNLSIRDNILFGRPYNEAKYRDVVHACALEPDFQMLPQGDSSFGGLRGLNLSGGQRQRVNVARAAYFGADTILLDNALSYASLSCC